jgi:hypothetical protein
VVDDKLMMSNEARQFIMELLHHNAYFIPLKRNCRLLDIGIDSKAIECLFLLIDYGMIFPWDTFLRCFVKGLYFCSHCAL